MTATTNLIKLSKRNFIEMMKDVGTSIPGHILAFDSNTQLAQIQIGVVRIDVNGKTFTPAPIIECPVYFQGGSEYFVTHQIDPGDEILIIFSQRYIDAWVNSGGVAQQSIIRFHDFSDAVVLPGLRSQPNKISSFNNNGICLRNKSGSQYVWLKNDGTNEIKGDTTIMGNLTVTGTIVGAVINALTSLIVAGINMLTHNHGGVQRGNSNTDGPQ